MLALVTVAMLAEHRERLQRRRTLTALAVPSLRGAHDGRRVEAAAEQRADGPIRAQPAGDGGAKERREALAALVGGQVRGRRGVERPVNLVGVTQGYQEIRRLLVLRGRYFDSTDMEKRDKVCLITKQLATRLFGPENAIGRSVRMGRESPSGCTRRQTAPRGETR